MSNDEDEGFKVEDLRKVPWDEINKTIDQLGQFAEKVAGAWGKHAGPIRAEELKAMRHSTYLTYLIVGGIIVAGTSLALAGSISSEAVVGLLGAIVGYIFGRR